MENSPIKQKNWKSMTYDFRQLEIVVRGQCCTWQFLLN